MNHRTAGDWTDVAYPYSYTVEMNPVRLRLAFLKAGLTPPPCATACELGFGQGVSVNIHAAATSGQWYGTDFNPAHAAVAGELAAASGAGARLFDESFADFCRRPDLPEFDYIALHGVWSWISDRDRAGIVDFVRRKLRPGGVLYVSYNTLPGCASMLPVREMLFEHVEQMNVAGQSLVSKIDAAIDFADKLLAADPAYLRAHPQAAERIKSLKESNRSYLAHEYFTRHWQPTTFARTSRWLAGARMNFACSASYFDHVPGLGLTSEQRKVLRDIPDPLFMQTVWDLMVNRQFRADYWTKGARRLGQAQQLEELRKQRVVLTFPAADIPAITLSTPLGTVQVPDEVVRPVFDVLADHEPRTLEQIEQAVAGKDISFQKLVDTVMLLISTNLLSPAQEESAVEQARRHTDKLNAALCGDGGAQRDIDFLASPLIGGGFPVHRFSKLFLHAAGEGLSQPEELASFVWKILDAQGERLIKDGAAIDDEAGAVAELARLAAHFTDKQLPLLRALRVA
ncbi:MAG TPA: class I SAM-dependent methyltransferase [Noviherbaspirillum sp.]|uniref:class I SAM-dependent methyltransferase n=1 Tax=Noviherbaspirillum sp. TaxID=1926288 RepID=UPI002D331994|nr:class I SAM-dependent methyltransferase [Noviherbaspirillum sp.]HYD97548.1 class I SAM-dependent methyltransferase [Noviherbaspirillum sp.]